MIITGLYVNIAACAVIFVWSTWCVFSQKVRDGLFGKLIFVCIAMAALAIVLGPSYGYTQPHRAAVTLNAAFAMLGIRHLLIKYFWPRIRRAVRCSICPHKDET